MSVCLSERCSLAHQNSPMNSANSTDMPDQNHRSFDNTNQSNSIGNNTNTMAGPVVDTGTAIVAPSSVTPTKTDALPTVNNTHDTQSGSIDTSSNVRQDSACPSRVGGFQAITTLLCGALLLNFLILSDHTSFGTFD